MEFDELVTKLMNHIDATAAKNKSEMIREVNVLMENQQKQFSTFVEGLDTLRDQMNRRFDEMDQRFDQNDAEHAKINQRFDQNDAEHAKMSQRFDQNDAEHANLKMIIRELATDQKEIKTKLTDLDQEFESKIRRVK